MPIKITCPHCEHVHRFSQPYPVPGSEVQCGCGRVLVISFPADMMSKLEADGLRFADPHATRGTGAPYEPAPTPALTKPSRTAHVGPEGPQGDHK